MKKNRILILNDNNPLLAQIQLMFKDDELYEVDTYSLEDVKDEIGNYQLIISMAYHDNNRRSELQALQLFYSNYTSNKLVKYIFLSWFHPLHHAGYFAKYFSFIGRKYTLMNTTQCEIIQMPQFKEIKNSIITLLVK